MNIISTGLVMSDKELRKFPIKDCIAYQSVGHRDAKGDYVRDGVEVLQYCMRADYEEDPEYHKDVLAALPCKRDGRCVWENVTKITGDISILQSHTAQERQLQLPLFKEEAHAG